MIPATGHTLAAAVFCDASSLDRKLNFSTAFDGHASRRRPAVLAAPPAAVTGS